MYIYIYIYLNTHTHTHFLGGIFPISFLQGEVWYDSVQGPVATAGKKLALLQTERLDRL